MSKPHSACWYRALSLNERIALNGEPLISDIDLGQSRKLEWRKQAVLESDDYYEGYLKTLGVSDEAFIRLLGEQDDSLQQRSEVAPDWLQQLHQYYSHDCELPPLSDAFKEKHQEYLLLVAVAPILDAMYRQFDFAIKQVLTGVENAPVDADWIRDQYFEQFVVWVLWVIRRPMVLELNISRLQEDFPGETSAIRFQAFIAHYAKSANALKLLELYPVMARKMVEQIPIIKQVSLNFLKRLVIDYEALGDKFFGGLLGKVSAIKLNLSDPHRDGRRVFKVQFDSHQQIIYKPKSLAVDQAYQQLLTFINQNNPPLPFKIIQVMDCGDYGWVECVAEESCQDEAQLDRFYQRQGINIALLYGLNANDFHYENLIAHGEHPVLIDLETLCQPVITDPLVSRDHAHLIHSTVLALGLLPYEGDSDLMHEVGGLGGASGQSLMVRKITGINTDEMQFELGQTGSEKAENLPTLEGKTTDAWLMTDKLEQGFTWMYAWLIQYRESLLEKAGPLDGFLGIELRTVIRNTVKYTALASASWHPDIVQNALFKDRLLAKLWYQGHKNTLYARTFRFEVEDLERGDVPLLSTHYESLDITANGNEWISKVFSKSGQQSVSDRLNAMDDVDMQRQAWLIRGTLDVRRPVEALAKKRWDTGLPELSTKTVARPEYLEYALSIGERLSNLMVSSIDQNNWFDITYIDEGDGVNRLRPMGLELYGGLCGMALFFEHLAREAGSMEMADVSHRAMQTIQLHVDYPQELIESGTGAFNGWPSIVYLYTHLARVRKDNTLLADAEKLVEVLSGALSEPSDFDLISGVSGTLLVLSQLSQQVDNPRIKQIVGQLAEWLASSAVEQPTGLGWVNSITQEQPLTGLGHGAAGVILALTEAAICLEQPRYLDIVKQALAYEDTWFCDQRKNWMDLRVDRMHNDQHEDFYAWCHGAPGIGLARVACARRLELASMGDPNLINTLRSSIRLAAESTLTAGFGDSHCLCHGDFGNLEMIMSAADYLDDSQLREKGERRAMQLLKSIDEYGYRCGSAKDRELLGLMLGLAGIGYGLLRLYNPQTVPNVLILEV